MHEAAASSRYLLGCDREEALRGRAGREGGSEVRVGAIQLVEALVGEVVDQPAADLDGLLVGRDLAESLPVRLERDAPETEVAHALLAHRVQERLEPSPASRTHRPLGDLDRVRAVGAGQPAVGRDHQDGGARRVGPVFQQGMLQGAGGVGGQVLHRPGQLLRVGP